jgi:hypothetical protein
MRHQQSARRGRQRLLELSNEDRGRLDIRPPRVDVCR